MTLKESQGGSWASLGDLKKGDIVKGSIKRLEAFGAFIELHNSTLTGLAHISQVSDDYVKNLQDVFQIGQGNELKPKPDNCYDAELLPLFTLTVSRQQVIAR